MSNLSTLMPSGGSGMVLLSRTQIDASTSFTKDPKAKLLCVICMGGGSGGKYMQNNSECSGGSGGDRVVEWLDASVVSSPIAVTIGAGGAKGGVNYQLTGYYYDEYDQLQANYDYVQFDPGEGGTTSFGTLVIAQGGGKPLFGKTLISFAPDRFVSGEQTPVMTGRAGGVQNTSSLVQYASASFPEGYGLVYTSVDYGGYTTYYNEATQLNSWAGNKGGVGAGRGTSGNPQSQQFTNVNAGRCYPDPLCKSYFTRLDSPSITGNGLAGIGDYPGSGGGGSNGNGGIPSGGGATGYGAAGDGARGRVIIYQYG